MRSCAGPDPHIVDVLIEERARNLMQRPLLWQLVRRFLYPAIGYRQTVELIDHVQAMTGQQIFDYMSERLGLRVEATGLDYIPKTGAAIVAANHPSGIADGFAVFDAIKSVRRDLVLFANRDAVRAAPGMTDIIIPVEWMEHRRGHTRNRETVRHMVRAFRDGKLVIIFPSGRLARPTLRGLVEREWVTAPVNLAQRYACPIVPMHIAGRNSLFYYLLYAINTELKDMTLFRELLNKTGKRYRIAIGSTIEPAGDIRRLTERIRHFVAVEMAAGAVECAAGGLRNPSQAGASSGTKG